MVDILGVVSPVTSINRKSTKLAETLLIIFGQCEELSGNACRICVHSHSGISADRRLRTSDKA